MIELAPLPLPTSADPSILRDFGREVKGVRLGALSPEDFGQIQGALYKHSVLLFRDVELTLEEQYSLTKAFDPEAENYGHGNNKVDNSKQSILRSVIKSIPRVPQVQLVGNGTIYDHEGIPEVVLKHPSHTTFHATHVSREDSEKGFTRFYRWHMDAALYQYAPPKVTTLYGLRVPEGGGQIIRYDDGTGDELSAPLATTAFVSGKIMFDILPPELKSLAVRSRAKYALHPFVWMSRARASPTGLGMESEGLELTPSELPPWDESKQKLYPMVWKNPGTGELHLQVHPCAVAEVLVDPLPEGSKHEGALYAAGAHLKDLKEIRDLLQRMQRPGIAPKLVYPHDWKEKDLMLFHNRGVIHTAVGTLNADQVRVFHQCNLAASDDPAGPTMKDVTRWA
ncbi:TfdA dioxygenase [Pleurotus pulmonarius]